MSSLSELSAPEHLILVSDTTDPLIPIGMSVDYSCTGTKILDQNVDLDIDPDGDRKFPVVCGDGGIFDIPAWPNTNHCVDAVLCKSMEIPPDENLLGIPDDVSVEENSNY